MDLWLLPPLAFSPVIIPLLGWWAACGGRVGKWVAATLLTGMILLVGKAVIETTYPRLLYSREEQVYMDRLVGALQAGETSLSLEELMPFEWRAVCFAYYAYSHPYSDEIEEVERETGQDISHWGNTGKEGEGILIFGTKDGPVVLRQLESRFSDPESELWDSRFYEKKLKSVAYRVNIQLKKASYSGRKCFRPDEVEVMIEKM